MEIRLKDIPPEHLTQALFMAQQHQRKYCGSRPAGARNSVDWTVANDKAPYRTYHTASGITVVQRIEADCNS